MTVAPKLPDFNARSAPIAAKLTQVLNMALWLLVATPLSLFAVSVAMGIIVATAVSRPVRDGRGFWFELLFVALFLAVRELIATPFNKAIKSRWFQTLLEGRPRFGPLKGPGKRSFQFILRCFASVNLRLEPEIETIFRKIGDYDALQVEAMYRRSYEEAGFEPSSWPDVWEQIQHTKFAGGEYGEAIRTNRWVTFLLKYRTVLKLVTPLSVLYAGGTFWLLTDVAQGRSPLRLVQFALVAGFVIAFVIFINYTVSLRVIRLIGKDEAALIEEDLMNSLDAETRTGLKQMQDSTSNPELESELEPYTGKDYYPTISVKPGYVEGIRNEFLGDFLVIGCFNVLALGLLLLAQWPIARVLSHWPSSQVDTWTVKMIVGTALIPIALSIALMLGFVVLSRFKKFTGVLATGLLLAVVPPLITYAVQGSVGNVVLLSSIVSAAIGVLPSAIAELVKQKPSLEGAH